MVLLLCLISGSGSQVTQRINYGVMFKKIATLDNAEQFWKHTFQMHLPNPEFMDITRSPCNIPSMAKTSQACDPDYILSDAPVLTRGLLQNILAIRNNTMLNLFKTLQRIHTIIPHHHINISKRKSRSLLPFIGSISKSLFGTATTKDLKILQNHMQQMTQKTDQVIHSFQKQEHQLSSYMTAVDHRVTNAFKGVKQNHYDITSLSKLIVSYAEMEKKSNNIWSHVLEFLTHELSKSKELESSINELLIGLQDVMYNRLSIFVIPVHILQDALTQIEKQLQQTYPAFQIVQKDIHHYYRTPLVACARHNNSIYVTIKVPISSHSKVFNVLEVITVPVPVNSSTNHATQLSNTVPYLAIDTTGQNYIELQANEFSKCTGKHHIHCPFALPQKSLRQLSCLSALYVNDVRNIKMKCDFKFLQYGISHKIHEVSLGQVLLSNISTITFKCSDGQVVKPGCKYCLLDIPCKCAVEADSYIIPEQIDGCKHIDSISKVFPVNLALLHHFFSWDDLKGITGNTYFKNPMDINVPKFNLVEHKFSNMVAKDQKYQLNLKKMAEAAKNNEKIYQDLTDPIYSGEWLPLDDHLNLQNLLSYLAIGYCILLTVAFIVMAIKLRQQWLAVTLLTAAKHIDKCSAEAIESFTLVWHPKTTTPKIQPALALSPTIMEMLRYIGVVLMIILMISFVVIILRKLAKKMRCQSVLFLEIGNGVLCTRIRLVELPGCRKNWVVIGTQQMDKFKLCHPFPFATLSIDWHETKLENVLLNQTVKLPEGVRIGLIEYWQLRKILNTPFEAHLILEHANDKTYMNILDQTNNQPSAPTQIYPILT